jgi:HD-GYP domain-containing protein (c-di-GMP phosphodiesterase class II)
MFAALSALILWFEGRLFKQDELVGEALALCAAMADSKDYAYTGHSERVARYSRMIAEHMGMDKQDCDHVYYAALLHNAGYNILPPEMLRKTTKLSGDEYRLMQTHTVRGADLLKGMKSVPHAEDAARYHHERYDGKGYPEGKKGNDIPLIARIISVADSFDSMNHERSYRKKYTMEHIREELISNNGTQFDPLVVSVFLEVMEEIED